MSGEKRDFFFAQMVAGFHHLVRNADRDQALDGGTGDGGDERPDPFQETKGDTPMNEATKVYNVLFLCTHNSARSLMGEAILNNLSISRGRFKAYSAGSQPSGTPNPFALECIRSAGLPVEGLRSKNWDEFALPEAPKLDFVFTVCDNAAKEVCPVWPGQPMSAHWGLPDPAAVQGTDEEKREAFSTIFRQLSSRIGIFTSLPMDKLDRMSLQKKLDDIGTAK